MDPVDHATESVKSGVSKQNIEAASKTVSATLNNLTTQDGLISRKSTETNKPIGPSTTISHITAVELQVFKTFVENYRATQELRREDAIALNLMFGPTIQQVFEMMDEDQVAIRQSPVSGRVLVEVCGKSGDTYWIPPGHSLCQCMSYVHGKKDYCKHVLAAHLKLAITPKEDYDPISDEELSKIYTEYLDDPGSGIK